ncbi:MAG: hypothetical protein KAS32_29235 [Candidatus Peribacteraceae bacterium]|nr:hypothetical protein [Candidatus Peribacteraceae bacterium]
MISKREFKKMSLIENPRQDDAISPAETKDGDIVFMDDTTAFREILGITIESHSRHEFILFQRVEFDQIDKSDEVGEIVTPYNFKILTGKNSGELITLWKTDTNPEKVYNA